MWPTSAWRPFLPVLSPEPERRRHNPCRYSCGKGIPRDKMILALSADGKELGFGGRGRQMTPLVTGSASAWEAAVLPLNDARDGVGRSGGEAGRRGGVGARCTQLLTSTRQRKSSDVWGVRYREKSQHSPLQSREASIMILWLKGAGCPCLSCRCQTHTTLHLRLFLRVTLTSCTLLSLSTKFACP